ncbi:hypothetical protein CIHG_10545 [Coccidioides immitis H538.4]|uniref:Uncharacterized protein n=1 Tax=Coccidioides immitis H538.4 TaxID=396776 RepID=A0A0J8S5M3_COCIT|nr:hypothetical protein CIHG_10545 [Coccidioides immitis H538.4]
MSTPSFFKEEMSRPSSIVASSLSSLSVTAALSVPAQASSVTLSLLFTVVAALALARNISILYHISTIFTQLLPAATFAGALWINLMVLSGLLFHTGTQALSVCKRTWYYEPIQRSVLIAGLNNSN